MIIHSGIEWSVFLSLFLFTFQHQMKLFEMSEYLKCLYKPLHL